MKVKSVAAVLLVFVISVNVFSQFVSSEHLFEKQTRTEQGATTPILLPLQEITSSDGTAEDQFGYSVSIDGNFAVAGAWLDDVIATNQGTAYLFMRSGATWSQTRRLVAPDAASNDQFGFSVDMDSPTQTIVVAAKADDNSSLTNNGSAYVFTNTGDNRKLIANDTANADQFGFSVAIDSNTIIVSTIGDDDNGLGSGSAYIFIRSGANWIQQAKLLPNDGVANDQFGYSVDISGNIAVVGARFENEGGFESGAAYVFVRSGTTWSQQAKLVADDAVSDEEFGWSVAIEGNNIIVGARNGKDSNGIATGAAYVFVRSGANWNQQAKLNASDGAIQDTFGQSVDIQANSAVVGSMLDDDSGSGSGSVYAFQRIGTTWTERRKLIASNGATGDNLGRSVSISGTTVFSGASRKNIPTPPIFVESLAGTNQGAGFFFNLLGPTAASASISGRVFSSFGRAIPRTIVHLTDQLGNTQTANTNQFGYYKFDDVEVGQTLILNAYSKQYQFTTQVVNFNETLTKLNIYAQ